jgi:hypothetical protein
MGEAYSTYAGEEKRGVYKVLMGRPEGKRPLERPGADGRILFKLIFRKWDMRALTLHFGTL